MMSLKKLLLVSAIAAVSSSAFAMESLEDGTLSDTVAQQGMDIFTSLNISGATLTYTDADGIATPATYTNSGDLKINGLGIVGDMTIAVDVGSTAAGPDAALFLGITGTTALNISLSGITVNKTGGGTNYNIVTMPATTISIGSGYNLALELGKGSSGHLGVLKGSIGTISIGTLGTAQTVAVVDTTNTGTVGVSQLRVTGVDLGSSAVNNTSIDVCNAVATSSCTAAETGLKVKFNGTAMGAVGLAMDNIRLGSSTGAIVGQMSVSGLNLSGTSLRIVGH
jgi:hypothetical protein